MKIIIDVDVDRLNQTMKEVIDKGVKDNITLAVGEYVMAKIRGKDTKMYNMVLALYGIKGAVADE